VGLGTPKPYSGALRVRSVLKTRRGNSRRVFLFSGLSDRAKCAPAISEPRPSGGSREIEISTANSRKRKPWLSHSKSFLYNIYLESGSLKRASLAAAFPGGSSGLRRIPLKPAILRHPCQQVDRKISNSSGLRWLTHPHLADSRNWHAISLAASCTDSLEVSTSK
jgi:hypothetical protein